MKNMDIRHATIVQKLVLAIFVISSTLVVITATALGVRLLAAPHYQTITQPADNVLSGFPMSGDVAPNISLVDQFGKSVTLSSLRGHEVVLAFIDARCKELCPLTAQIMYEAKAHLGASAASQVALVAVNANPAATSIAAVQSWSIEHGMLHQWLFLTGPAKQLQSIYHLYNVYVQVDARGQSEHDPVIYIIDATGHERLSFETLNSSAQVDLNSEEAGLEIGMRQWLPQK
jgi:cytochrome oxidase Cu insertion factor (SCO1/SenC/PrrC family)